MAHLASRDLATWTVVPPALVPGRWGGPIGGVGHPTGNATGGYYSCGGTVVNGVPRIIVPAVMFTGTCSVTCPGNTDPWLCMLDQQWRDKCPMVYAVTEPVNLTDPLLVEWTEPITMVDGRTDGIQPHGPGFDDTTHAWIDPEDAAAGIWRFAGQTTVCVTPSCNDNAAGDRPTYLQLFASKAGDDWTQGFAALGDLFPVEPNNEPDRGIMNVPGFWKRSEVGPFV